MERTLLPKARLPSLACVTSHGLSLWFKTAGVSPPLPPAWPGKHMHLDGQPQDHPPPRELRRDKAPRERGREATNQ